MFKHRIINKLVIASCLSLSACQFFPGYADPAMVAFVRGDYIQAYKRLEHRARLGDPAAQYAVGYMSYYGLGAPQNRDLAINWFEAAARFGYQPAQQAMRILTHDVYKAQVNVTQPMPMQPMKKVAMNDTVDWIREKRPENYTIEVRKPKVAEALRKKNYPLVSYRYMDQDNIQEAWIMGDFKTEEQARAIQSALLEEKVPARHSQYYLQSGLTNWVSDSLRDQCLNTQATLDTPTSYNVVIGPFANLEEATQFQTRLPVNTSIQSYSTTKPVHVALKSMRDIQLAMLP